MKVIFSQWSRSVSMLTALAVPLLAFSIGCGNPAPNGDAATGDASTDAPVSDAPSPSTDAPACANFDGVFSVEGSCNVIPFSLSPTACVVQTGCETITMATESGFFEGTVEGNTATLSSTQLANGQMVTVTCTITRRSATRVTVACDVGGRVQCEGMGTPQQVNGASRVCCNVASQNCGAGNRCTPVNNPVLPMGALVPACIPAAGMIAEGMPCTYTEEAGRDQCAAGLYCTRFGNSAPGMGTCRKLCDRSDFACGAGKFCARVSSLYNAGVCVPSCPLFDPTAMCPAMTRCFPTGAEVGMTGVGIVGACRALGTSMPGEACVGARDTCVDGYDCNTVPGDSSLKCRKICDATHPCDAGQRCNPYGGATLSTTTGLCYTP